MSTYNKGSLTNEDTDQPVQYDRKQKIGETVLHESLESVEALCQKKMLWLDFASAQADLRFHWLHMFERQVFSMTTHITLVQENGYTCKENNSIKTVNASLVGRGLI